MTAGRGIVHSERASRAGLKPGASVHGAQFWLALPKSHEDFPHSALCVDVSLTPGERLAFPPVHPERGVYIVSGGLEIGSERHEANRLLVLEAGETVEMKAIGRTLLLLIGGEPMDGPRYLDWNFVASSKERLADAKADWQDGRFPKVPGETEFIPYP